SSKLKPATVAPSKRRRRVLIWSDMIILLILGQARLTEFVRKGSGLASRGPAWRTAVGAAMQIDRAVWRLD
ncbi:hypothetical protein PQQ53_34480, partial [Paraburkholderia strydomiana]|uniref:hypothetical protein n=1 Tax=Paraburkholderia strydomiana TaxID=1245417 RepID=UPI0038BCB91B